MQTAITLTTIYKPLVIEEYLKNIIKYNHKDTEIIVVEDKKTPSGVKDFCDDLSKKYSITIKYLDLKFQKNYLIKYPDLDKYLPFNSFARRNIGDLFAYERGFNVVIRVDDDNCPLDDDFVGTHNLVGKNIKATILNSKNGWYNVCEELIDKDGMPFYPRGFLYNKRWKKTN